MFPIFFLSFWNAEARKCHDGWTFGSLIGFQVTVIYLYNLVLGIAIVNREMILIKMVWVGGHSWHKWGIISSPTHPPFEPHWPFAHSLCLNPKTKGHEQVQSFLVLEFSTSNACTHDHKPGLTRTVLLIETGRSRLEILPRHQHG